MDGSLKNKTMIVTGASSGIGAAAARRFAAEGVKLALVARSAERLKALADELGSECIALPLDLTKPSDVATMVKATADRFGHIDILFANAGSYVAGDVAERRSRRMGSSRRHQCEERVSRGPRGVAGHDRPPLGRHRRHLVDLGPSGDSLGAGLFGDQACGAIVRSWRAPASRQAQCAGGIAGAGHGSERALGPDRSGTRSTVGSRRIAACATTMSLTRFFSC